jgi:hypothetical protein
MVIDLIGITEPGQRAFIIYKEGKKTHCVTLQVHDKKVWVQAPGVIYDRGVYDKANVIEYAAVAQLLLLKPVKLKIYQVDTCGPGMIESIYSYTSRR